MEPDNRMLETIASAENFIDRTFMNCLDRYPVIPAAEYEKKYNLIRLFRIQKIVYDSAEAMDERLVSIFHSVMPFCRSLVFIIKGMKTHAELYIGVKASVTANAAVAGNVLRDSFVGNFPGTKLDAVGTSAIETVFGQPEGGLPLNSIASLSMIPSERGVGRSFVQGLEKFIDTMRGYEYTVEIVAAPKSAAETEARRQGLEEIYSALCPFAKETSSHGTNVSESDTQGINESISRSIADGISKAVGQTDGYNRGVNSGHNIGFHLLLNFGMMKGRSEGWSNSYNRSDTSSSTRTNSDTYGTQHSSTRSEGVTDNLTVEYRNKTVENLLEKIDRHLSRIRQGNSYGLWEAGTFFMADKRTAAMAAGIFSSLLSGEESGFENVNINFFDAGEKNAAAVEESLRFCQFPLFRIPVYEAENASGDSYTAAPGCYINGRELALLMDLPRKSVSGVNVTQTAEFGRNPQCPGLSEQNSIAVGRVYHMGQTENTAVRLDLNSLTGHCFVTGSTGSGKSNTVYRLIENLSSEEHKIPFLVIEPAKGEYRDEFRDVEGIRLFSTNPQIDRMLKINPFSFREEIHVLEHLDRLVEIFNGCWEMYAAMPAILKEAMENAYIDKGWDLLNSVYTGEGGAVFPTFSDVLAELPKIINRSQYSSETKGDYIGALVTRVNSMTNGIYGQIFCDDIEVADEELFDGNAVVDLSRVGSSETKSLLMGIIILKLTEYRMAKAGAGNAALKHVTVLEEAHNILKNTKNAASSNMNGSVIAKSVEMIVNSIAEMRTYGEGFVIVDQSPTSVDIAAVKNTNTKIIMRLPEKDDCELAGRAVSLNKKQIGELAKLETGVAVVMQNNWELPVLAKIDAAKHRAYRHEDRVPFSRLKQFRSDLLGELIGQFILTDDRDVEKILRRVETAEIPDHKKAEYKHLVTRFAGRLADGFDCRFVGRTFLRLAGCGDMFRNSEKLLQYRDPEENGPEEAFTEESLADWNASTDAAIRRCVDLDGEQRETLKQYIVFSGQFEQHNISYTLLYDQLYSGIK